MSKLPLPNLYLAANYGYCVAHQCWLDECEQCQGQDDE